MDERVIRARLQGIKDRSAVWSDPIDGWEARTADYLAPGQYRYDGKWASVPGETLWPPGRTLFLRAGLSPREAGPRCARYLAFDVLRMEGLLSIDGTPWAGIDAQHARAPLAGIPAGAVAHGRRLDLELEFACVPAAAWDATLRREKARFRDARLVAVDCETEALYYDVAFAAAAARALQSTAGGSDRRGALIASAVEDALLALDLTADAGAWRAAIQASRALLVERLSSIAPDPESGRIFLTGHSHIDTAWLWPLRETVRKCSRTFSTACRLMEQFPSYRFSCSQPQLYAFTRRYYPAVYEGIGRWVREGRWEATGAMWVESDCNIPSGESLVRQILHGVAFFRAEFGTRPRTCWLPDVFGYPASLPGILAGSGIEFFYTNKLHWQARNAFPVHLFHWQGIDGSRVLGHVPRLVGYYNGSPTPPELRAAWEGFHEKAVHAELLFPFGHGDGGGGPTEEMIAFADRAAAFPGVPRCRQGLEEQYFREARAAGPQLPCWVGELYLETHRGTLTTQSEVKRANRRGEMLLREAEIFLSLSEITAGAAAVGTERTRLRDAWENLLLLQFHDILPGSSIGEVYREALRDYRRIQETAQAVRDAALARLAGTRRSVPAGGGAPTVEMVAWNSLSWERHDSVEAEVPDFGDSLEVVLPEAGVVPAQVVGRSGDTARIVFSGVKVPAVGMVPLVLRRSRRAAASTVEIAADGRRIETTAFLVEIGDDGTIRRLLDKRHDREVIPAGAGANDLQLYQDGPEEESAWNIHPTYTRRRYEWDSVEISPAERGPVRGAVMVRRRYRSSVVEQRIVVWSDIDRIDFVTRAQWQERQVLLKAAFPLEVRAERATFEIQYGAVERPTHRNTSWEQEKFEVCGHRWADLSEAGYGVSLLNDGRYGWDALGSTLRLTLLRGPEWPDPDADRGEHEITYSLLPHGGDWRDGQTARRAWELNAPLGVLQAASESIPSVRTTGWVTLRGPATLEALKPAEDGDGWIIRLSELQGGRGRVTLVLAPAPLAVEAVNHAEETLDPAPPGTVLRDGTLEFPMTPFAVRSFRLRYSAASHDR